MTLPASIALNTTFDLSLSTPKFKLINQTDFNAEGITLSNVKGNFKIVNPLNVVVYENTSTVTPDLYSFAVTSITRVLTTATVTSSTPHNLVTGDWVLIGGAAQSEYNILAQVTRLGNTQFTYQVSGSPTTPATGTILGLKMNLSTISIPLDMGTFFPFPGAYSITLTTIVAAGVQPGTYVKQFDYQYEYTRPVVSITQSVDCFTPRYTSIDTTTYMVNGVQPTISRTQTLSFPPESGISPQSFVTQIVQIDYPLVWNGDNTTVVQTDLLYVFSDDLNVKDRVTGSSVFQLACDVTSAALTCCLNDLNQRYTSALTTNPTLASQLFNQLQRALQLQQMYWLNISNGQSNEASQNLTDFYQVTNCTSDCNCGAQQVIPYNGFIGKTILEWNELVGNSQFDYINYQNVLYHVLQNTTPGQNPTDNPSLYQQIG